MATEKKAQQVKALEDKLKRSTIAVSTENKGLTASQMTELRRKLREKGVELVVVKNTLLGIAADNTGKAGLRQVVRGPTAVAFGYGDIVDPAKVLHQHILESKVPLQISGAVMNGQVLSAAEVQALAVLPSKQVLMGKLVGAVIGPVYGLAYVLNYHVAGLARVLEARRKQLEGAKS